MRYVLFYESAGADREQLMEHFPEHQALWSSYAERGELLLIGPFTDRSGAMGVFTTREAAEAFAAEDPFVTKNLVGSWQVREWMEALGDTS
ncbi:MAG TPA: YciI family protein [Jatrophihabitantaceae bacterium]|nr:YciI family protein [Jatrophihabitantaceae bacterium]